MPIVADIKQADVVVIGAGITGLSTAYEVQKAGLSVIVLEASDQVGGRIITRERAGDLVEVGQQYFLSTYSTTRKLLDEIGMSSELVIEKNSAVQYIDRKGGAHTVDGIANLLRLLGVRGIIDLARATFLCSTMGKHFPPYDVPAVMDGFDDITVSEGFSWASDNFLDYIMRPMCLGTLGTSIEHSSFFDAVRLFRNNLKQPVRYGFQKGNKSVPERLSQLVPVTLNACVRELLMNDGKVTGVRLEGGRRINADHVIICTTPDVAAKLTPAEFTCTQPLFSNLNNAPLILGYFYLDRPLNSAGMSISNNNFGDRYFNLSMNHTVLRPHLVPSGKAIISSWPTYPNGQELLAMADQEILDRAFEEMKLFYPSLSKGWVEHAEVVRHEWGISRHAPGDYGRLRDFQDSIKSLRGLSYANADFNLVSMEAGVLMGRRAADRAIQQLK